MKKRQPPRPSKRKKRPAAPAPVANGARYAARVRLALSRHDGTRETFDEALAGRGDGIDILADAPLALHGPVVVAMHLAGVPPAKLRPVLRAAWCGNSFYSLTNAARSQGLNVPAMMRAAEFAIPDSLPETFVAWRGCAGKGIRAASAGWSWTLDRDFACYAAVKLHAGRGAPMVLLRTIRRADVAAYIGLESTWKEREVVVDRAEDGEMDGDPAAWVAAAARWEASFDGSQDHESWRKHEREILA